MKKLTVLILIVVAAMTSKAQGFFDAGIKAGMNTSKSRPTSMIIIRKLLITIRLEHLPDSISVVFTFNPKHITTRKVANTSMKLTCPQSIRLT